MISSTIWISSDEARTFRLTPERVIEKHFKKEGVRHSATQQTNHHAEAHESDKLFEQVSDALLKNSDDRFLIIGPGPAKVHFKTYVDKHFPKAKIIGLEATDKMTDGEILDFTHHFFRKIDSFQT